MTTERHLDGNAVGALLTDVFGREMTDHRACCDACGSVNRFAAAIVFRDAPGDVLRCGTCGTVLLVAVAVPTGLRVSFRALRWIEVAPD